MAEFLDNSPRVFECEGPDAVLDAATKVLYEGMDLAVIRGIVKAKDLLKRFECMLDMPVIDSLYGAVPLMDKVDELCQQYWSEQGFRGYKLREKQLNPALVKHDPIGIHTDYGDERINPVFGPLTWSICTQGSGTYNVERPAETFRRPDGSFDRYKWSLWKKLPAPKTLRSSTEQNAGDAVVFLNHPQQSWHSVEQAPDTKRVAALFEHIIFGKS